MKKLMAIGQAMIIGMTVFVFQAQSQVIIDKAEMTPVTIGGVSYLAMENIPFVQNGEVSFLGFDQDLTTMLRPDLFENISDITATFVGQSRYWRAFYNTVNEFMYLQTYNNEEGLLWLAGLGAGFPLPPYAATSDWFETEAHGYFSFKRTGTDIYEMLAYLNEDMAFQVYRKVMWNMVVSPMVSLTPSLLTIQANNDVVPGPGFVPGVYNLKVNVDAGTVELIPYNPLEGKFPIIAWTGLNANELSTKLPVMKEAGFNIYLQWYDNLATTLEALEDAEEAGIKMIASCPELKSNTGNTVKAMMNKSALYGYHLDDEPELNEIPGLALWTTNIQSIDSKHPCYINLYPNWAWGGATGYAVNVNTFLNQVPVSYFSFDNYPIVETNGVSSLHPDWYKNLEDAASTRNRGVRFWAFALALSHSVPDIPNSVYPIPTLAELRLQMFSNLVYGAQGFQYFTYWGIHHDDKTVVYEPVKKVNRELQSLSSIFLEADIISVWHTGSQLPIGTHPIDQLPDAINSLATSDNGAVVSFLQNGDKQYLAVVNKDYRNSMQLTMSLDSEVKQVLKDGTILSNPDEIQSIEAGDIAIFMWSINEQAQVTIDKAEMTPVTIGGIPYLVMENIPFVQNGEVSFLGFDQDLTTMLRPDLFENISDNTATFVGQSRYWRAFYNTANEFMYLQTYNNEESLLWLAGLGAGFPLPPYAATSDWFEAEAHGYFSFKRTGTNVYEMLVYLNDDMALQVYRKVMWNMVVSPMVSLTPSLLTIQANNDAVPGPGFVPGIYTMRVNVDAGTMELIPYSELLANTKQFFQEGPSTNTEQSLLGNRSIYCKDNQLFIINKII